MQEFLKINDKHYMVDIREVPGEEADDKHMVKCSIFDLVQLWCEIISVQNLVDREKKTDSIINYTSEVVHETILARKADDYSIQEHGNGNDGMCLKLKYYVSGYPVTFSMQLKLATKEELSETILIPVWRAMLLLYEENCALKELLIKKDIEIEQYKVEGAVLKRSLVATSKFDEQKFAENFPLYAPDEGIEVREIVRNKDRRASLMKLLKVRHRELPGPGSPLKLSSTSKDTSFTSSPTKKSPGGRTKGINALYAKQRIPKATPASSVKRFQPDLSEDEDKEAEQKNCDTVNDTTSEMNDTRGASKVRKITKL